MLSVASGLILLVAGCASNPSMAEKQARADVANVGAALQVGEVPSLRGGPMAQAGGVGAPRLLVSPPRLAADSPESDYILYALYRHPAVRAAYFDWRASVAAIAPARSLPDPKFTFQADIASMVTSFMPGVMFDVMAWEKRAAMGREATAASRVAYRDYVTAVLTTAAGVRKAWVELAYAEDTDRLYGHSVRSAEQAVALAGADYVTTRGMVNFDQQVRFQNMLAEHHAHHAAIADLIAAARAKLKSALGLLPTDDDPPWPATTLRASPLPSEAELWRRAVANNADVARMRAMVDMALAGVDVARQSGTPDFSAGAMVDLKTTPVMYRPTATISLPVWRDKIRGNVAAAAARREGAAARVTAEELNLAAELAELLYMVRKADRMLDYIDRIALPNLERTLGSAEAASESGMGSSTMIAETQLMAIDLRHERLDMLRDREDAAVDLALLIADVTPEGTGLLGSRE